MHHPIDPWQGASSRVLSWFALIGLAAASWRCVSATHARRLGAKAAALPESLQAWEGEGGQNQMPDSPPARPKEAELPGARVRNSA